MRPTSFLAMVVACAVGFLPPAARAQAPTVLRPAETPEAASAESHLKPPVITAVAVIPGGGLLATAGDDHVVRIWSTETGDVVHTLKGHGDWVRALAFSPDGQVLASAGDDRRVTLWNVANGERHSLLPPHPHVIYALAYSPDGAQLATAGFEQKVRLYDPAGGTLLRELDGPGVDLRTVAFCPDGSHLAAAGRGGTIRVWSLADGQQRRDIAAGSGRIRTLAYLPGPDRLVSASEDRTISIWDAESGERIGQLHSQGAKVLSLVVCGPNLIATGGSDNIVRIWNWQTQVEAQRLLGHTGSVASLAFDPTSGTIVSGSFDTTVRVWKPDALDANPDTAGIQEDSRVR